MKPIILSTKGLCKSFAHNGRQSHILNNINLEVHEGDFTVIMGTSGSGKSTLLYCLSGMDHATAGQVHYQEKDIVTCNEDELAALRHRDFGFIFQQMHLISNLTLFENIVIPGYLEKEKTAKEVDTYANVLIEKMELSKVKTHLPSQLSGGEQQRTAIARAIIHTPKLLFADEPTGALNRNNTTEVLNLLTSLNQEGQSILMVTHDLHAALRATRLLYLTDGSINGELTLSPYKQTEEKSRETQINAWLSSMKW